MKQSEKIVQYTEQQMVAFEAQELLGKLAKGDSQTDWDKVNSISEDDVDDSDLGDDFWANAVVVKSPNKKPKTIRYDADVLAWYMAQGKGYQSMMNNVLRTYMEAQLNT